MNFGDSNLMFIIALEVIALCVFFIAILSFKNRKLKRLLRKLQKRMEELLEQVKQSRAQGAPAGKPAPLEDYSDKLNKQIAATIDHHGTLGTRQDISLDLDPDTPLPRLAAAFRNAVLITEKEATAHGEDNINWDIINTRYQQLLSYHADYAAAPTDHSDELQQIKEELTNAKKRINNLERFKVLYFELEEKWEKCKNEADVHYTELKGLVSGTENADDFEQLLDSYHDSYVDIGKLIHTGAEESSKPEPDDDPEQHLLEIRRLRSMAEDQHKIITELQAKLKDAPDKVTQETIVDQLSDELKRQSRFLQESETCIKLMEDELKTAQEELDSLRARTQDLPKLRAQNKELESAAAIHEQIVGSLKQENRRLAKKLQVATESGPAEDSKEVMALRKELTSMQSKYNDLEEKYLDLKLKD